MRRRQHAEDRLGSLGVHQEVKARACLRGRDGPVLRIWAGLRAGDSGGLSGDRSDTPQNVGADRDEEGSPYRDDNTTNDRPFHGLETALVQHEALD